MGENKLVAIVDRPIGKEERTLRPLTIDIHEALRLSAFGRRTYSGVRTGLLPNRRRGLYQGP